MGRLPVTGIPKHYQLLLEPELEKAAFSGTVRIALEAPKPTKRLVLHAAELEVTECWVEQHGRRTSGKPELDPGREQLLVKLPAAIAGKAVLGIAFRGQLNNRLIGFYRSEYAQRTKRLATTQFEAADARRCFPCWDEPELKATFEVAVKAKQGLVAVSNMPVVSQRKVSGKILHVFGRTPVMSTYLLYVGVGEFEWLEDALGPVRLRVMTVKGKKEQGRLALGYAKEFLAWYQSYFGIPFPLPKLDFIAVPDFASGAMENWGAIAFRETALLFDPATSSAATKQRIAEVVSHELAHQWFGNLVTMEWWNDLWLNESFATFMAAKSVAELYPEWEFWEQFLEQETAEALALDGLRSSHPIAVDVRDPRAIREIFDAISYEKGGSVLRMLERWVGPAAFRKGLQRYLRAHRYGNATKEDLWGALAAASRKPVRAVMDTWVLQQGYPLLSASRVEGGVEVRQSRFLLEANGRRGARKERWQVPIEVEGMTSAQLLLRRATGKIAVRGWTKLNAGQTGFYRVRYDPESQERLRTARLNGTDRWGVLSDLFALCLAGEVGVRQYLDFIRPAFAEDRYIVAAELAQALGMLWLLSSSPADSAGRPLAAGLSAAARAFRGSGLRGEPWQREVARIGREFFRRQLSRLGWDPKPDERHTDTLLRSSVISCLGRMGEQEVVEEAKRRFDTFLKTGELDANIRAAVYGLVAWAGGAEVHALLTERYRKAKTQEERMRLLAALAGFQDRGLLERTLAFALSEEVRLQDITAPISRLAVNPAGQALVWPWLQQHWAGIGKRFGGVGSPLLNRLVKALALCVPAERESEVKRFFAKHPVPSTEMAVAQTCEWIRIYGRLRARARKEFRAP